MIDEADSDALLSYLQEPRTSPYCCQKDIQEIHITIFLFRLNLRREKTNVKGTIKCKNIFIVVGEIYLPLMRRNEKRSNKEKCGMKNLIKDNRLMSIYLTSKLPRKMQLTKIVF